MNESSLYEKTVKCIRCGFCLEACPTFVITGKETESPRGRIYLVRSALEGELQWDKGVLEHIDTCLGCRACETACPSGVEYGSILEMAREKLEDSGLRSPMQQWARNALLSGISNPAIMRKGLALSRILPGKRMPGFLSRLLGNGAGEADIPKPTNTGKLYPAPTVKPSREAYFLRGCAMSVLYADTNAATEFLLRHHGVDVIKVIADHCCGALHLHSGKADDAKRMAIRLIAAFPGDAPMITNSAGCGSAMKEYGELLATHDAKQFSNRVRDISEYLDEIGFKPPKIGRKRTIAYHDACHLAHGQGIREQPRKLLSSLPGVTLVEMEEADRCCGSAGTYNLTQPQLARQLLERKWRFIEQTGAEIIATGNPGCLAWLQQAAREKGSQVRIIHTADVLADAF